MYKKKHMQYIIILILLFVISISGVLSIDFTKAHSFVNQYGDTIKIYGNGIYKNDSYFKAAILIGTDFFVLLYLIPLLIYRLIKNFKEENMFTRLNLIGVLSLVLYYSVSICFGVTYNKLFILYVLLFSLTLFTVFQLFGSSDMINMFKLPKSVKIFLLISGMALFVAWLPDIIISIVNKTSLQLIENYTTEITYILDMGIIAPLCIYTIYCFKNGNAIGVKLLWVLFELCKGVAVMMFPQTIMQYLSGIDVPIIALITKSIIFVILGAAALLLKSKCKKIIDTDSSRASVN